MRLRMPIIALMALWMTTCSSSNQGDTIYNFNQPWIMAWVPASGETEMGEALPDRLLVLNESSPSATLVDADENRVVDVDDSTSNPRTRLSVPSSARVAGMATQFGGRYVWIVENRYRGVEDPDNDVETVDRNLARYYTVDMSREFLAPDQDHPTLRDPALEMEGTAGLFWADSDSAHALTTIVDGGTGEWVALDLEAREELWRTPVTLNPDWVRALPDEDAQTSVLYVHDADTDTIAILEADWDAGTISRRGEVEVVIPEPAPDAEEPDPAPEGWAPIAFAPDGAKGFAVAQNLPWMWRLEIGEGGEVPDRATAIEFDLYSPALAVNVVPVPVTLDETEQQIGFVTTLGTRLYGFDAQTEAFLDFDDNPATVGEVAFGPSSATQAALGTDEAPVLSVSVNDQPALESESWALVWDSDDHDPAGFVISGSRSGKQEAVWSDLSQPLTLQEGSITLAFDETAAGFAYNNGDNYGFATSRRATPYGNIGEYPHAILSTPQGFTYIANRYGNSVGVVGWQTTINGEPVTTDSEIGFHTILR